MYDRLVAWKKSETMLEKGYLRPTEKGYSWKYTQEEEMKLG